MSLRDEAVEAIVKQLADLPSQLRQTLADHLWASVGTFVAENAYNANLAIGATLTARAQVAGLEKIESVTACVPAGATAVVQLGDKVLYVGQGVTTVPGLAVVLQTTDLRGITIAGSAGPTALLLTGVAIPTFGVLPK
jgi:hypothetical protein